MAENRPQSRIQSTSIRMCSLRLQIDAVFAYKSSLERKNGGLLGEADVLARFCDSGQAGLRRLLGQNLENQGWAVRRAAM